MCSLWLLWWWHGAVVQEKSFLVQLGHYTIRQEVWWSRQPFWWTLTSYVHSGRPGKKKEKKEKEVGSACLVSRRCQLCDAVKQAFQGVGPGERVNDAGRGCQKPSSGCFWALLIHKKDVWGKDSFFFSLIKCFNISTECRVLTSWKLYQKCIEDVQIRMGIHSLCYNSYFGVSGFVISGLRSVFFPWECAINCIYQYIAGI